MVDLYPHVQEYAHKQHEADNPSVKKLDIPILIYASSKKY
jgi:hypothetical protein